VLIGWQAGRGDYRRVPLRDAGIDVHFELHGPSVDGRLSRARLRFIADFAAALRGEVDALELVFQEIALGSRSFLHAREGLLADPQEPLQSGPLLFQAVELEKVLLFACRIEELLHPAVNATNAINRALSLLDFLLAGGRHSGLLLRPRSSAQRKRERRDY